MWCKQNSDTSWIICEEFFTVINGIVTKVDSDFDKRRKPNGFDWESDPLVIEGRKAHNLSLELQAQADLKVEENLYQRGLNNG